ncbi:hypothetical protein ED28_09520 [[Pantoea] beijingensis]|uniref:Uncharacterized protein n=1 Tax=[Pantoea] beijingensis TaxID=1324864 RepID=A0A443ID98_9GAMM|nr:MULTISPECIES: hypothetical protein [Erwiniaceae]RWR01870.1 hypothetical protein ED28_09520 [[Pantoea] beijingensis]
MKEEDASLMIIQNAIASLPEAQKQRVSACIASIRQVMAQYEAEDAGLALMLVAAEVAAQ